MTPAPLYGWFGDDFTGATDTLATLAERGFRARLFLGVPSPEQLAAAGPLDAIGIAGATRSMPPEEMTPILDKAGRFFAAQGVRIMHYKCCSTFDSAPHVGSIGAAVAALRPHFPEGPVTIIGGQPNLGRYCLFGHLFAAAGDGDVYRIDRHPTMSRHPVTPMGESDLKRHLALQGLTSICSVSYRELEEEAAALARCDAVTLFDVSRESDLAAIARLCRSRIEVGPGLFVGASSVARMAGVLAGHTTNSLSPRRVSREYGHVLALVGSLSPVTREQVEAAHDFLRLSIDTMRLKTEPAYGQALCEQVLQSLRQRDTMLVTAPPDGPFEPRSVAAATGRLLRSIMERATIARLLVAGGDTSTLAIEALDIWGLAYRSPLVDGAPLCRAHSALSQLDGLELVLKGGQMGPSEFFRLASA
ncbi:MAG: four-carbon acid sugar kinase family protein [Bosea sp. (in: a-proteobacteria)]|uniref:four-carbon acid sugar kinase family protein n=1 Tax=Bosea sp. (in: a-proteobacteria) TaxID=1871050 RepID=UPI003F7C2AE7